MLKVLIRNSDKKVMPCRQDSPAHRPGVMAAAYAKRFGGNASDYTEYCVPDKEKEFYMAAKELKWDKNKERVKAIPFSGKEKKDKRDKEKKLSLEHAMVRAQMELDASSKLGLDEKVKEHKKSIAEMKKEHRKLKDV